MHPDVEVQFQSGGYFFPEELPKAAVLRIDPAQQFSFVKSNTDGVIGLSHARLPRRGLTGHNICQSIEITDNVSVDRFVECKQSGLMGKQLADRDPFLAPLAKLRPVRPHAFIVIEPSTGMRQRKCHRREAFGRRAHNDHGVFLPWFAGGLVPNPAPQVDDLFALTVYAARCAHFFSKQEILEESVPNGFKAFSDVPLNPDRILDSCHCLPAMKSGQPNDHRPKDGGWTNRLALVAASWTVASLNMFIATAIQFESVDLCL